MMGPRLESDGVGIALWLWPPPVSVAPACSHPVPEHNTVPILWESQRRVSCHSDVSLGLEGDTLPHLQCGCSDGSDPSRCWRTWFSHGFRRHYTVDQREAGGISLWSGVYGEETRESDFKSGWSSKMDGYRECR